MRAVAYVAHRRISTLKLPSGEGSHQRHRLANGGRNPQYYCSRVAVAVRSTRPHGAAGGTIQCSKSQSCLTVSSTTLFTPWPTDHHVLIQSGRDQRSVERMEQRFLLDAICCLERPRKRVRIVPKTLLHPRLCSLMAPQRRSLGFPLIANTRHSSVKSSSLA